jgi:hypothetical protein
MKQTNKQQTSLESEIDALVMPPRVLVACEYSGIVREAFATQECDAWSCDLLPTEKPGNHIEGNVLDILDMDWDLMIGHPPCTYISYAGNQVWNKPGRVFKRIEALKFFAELWEASIPHICLENPKSCASPTVAKYSQEIQPYYFGNPHFKTTWLWLKNLPKLKYKEKDDLFGKKTSVGKPEPLAVDGARDKKRYFTESATRDPKERARFWPEIAKAMAQQWTPILAEELAV